MHITIISRSLLVIAASRVALAAPGVQSQAPTDRRMPPTETESQINAAVVKRNMGNGQITETNGSESGMCMCPCGSTSAVPYSGMQTPDYKMEYDGGNYGDDKYGNDKGNEDGKYDQMQREADKALKEKYKKLMQKNKKYEYEKNKKREEEMQKKYGDISVLVEVVHVMIEIDSSGKQKPERYAMSRLTANNGKSKTTTCHLTAAETITIGAGSCDNGAANGEKAADTAYPGADVVYSNGEKKMDKNKNQEMGKMKKPQEMGKMENPKERDKMNKTQETGKMDKPQEAGQTRKSQDANKKEKRQEAGNIEKSREMGNIEKSQEMGNIEKAQEIGKSSDMNKVRSTSQSQPSQGQSQDISPEAKNDKGQTHQTNPARIRRQQGGTVNMVMATFIESNDTMIVPAYMGRPQHLPGVVIMDNDPAKDTANEGGAWACGISS